MAWFTDWNKTVIYVGLSGLTFLVVRRAFLYFTTKCPSKALMNDKTVIITGANSGIGYATALELARRKARVILACRDLSKAEIAANKIIKLTGNDNVFTEKLDLASLRSVREFCRKIEERHEKVNVLINNAGVMKCPFSKTEDGFEMHMAVNHFGNFLMTNLLKDMLCQEPDGRVIFVSSSLHRFGSINLDTLNTKEQYTKGKPYSDSKLMNLLFARELHKRVAIDGSLCVNSMHPGMVRTQLGRYSFFFNKYFRIFGFPLFAILYPLYLLLVKSATEGCQTVVYLAVDPDLKGESDGYYSNCKKELWSGPSCDESLARQVWDISAKLTHLGEE